MQSREPPRKSPMVPDIGSTAPSGISVSLEPLQGVDALGRSWTRLEAESDVSFFQSWGWIKCWLDLLPERFEPLVLMAKVGGRLAGLGLLVANRTVRRGIIRSHRLLLHETGSPEFDSLCIEHNGFLAARPFAADIVRACLARLDSAPERWNEVVLGGVGAAYVQMGQTLKRRCMEARRSPSPYADLAAIRSGDGDFLATLSRNTRYQIRRSMKLYEAQGPLGLREAQSVEEALGFLDQLVLLHQRYWAGRGQPGAFANETFLRFHKALISSRFSAAEIQLLKVGAGPADIGYLYNFRWRGHVYQYQSGLDHNVPNKLKPGLVSHCLAIQHNLAQGADKYDFLAGGERYKSSLTNASSELVWISLQRRQIRFQLENVLRSTKRRLIGRAGS